VKTVIRPYPLITPRQYNYFVDVESSVNRLQSVQYVRFSRPGI